MEKNSGTREIDAEGLVVTPGFVDVHTHYDAQVVWDPFLSPSHLHGVTTAVFGNCGVGFAPVRRGNEDFLIDLMEGVEDIPRSVLESGLTFEWESFSEYLDHLDRHQFVMDIGAQIPHSALRLYVMGERGSDHRQAPTAEEIDSMAAIVEESVVAGALGFTSSRSPGHRTLAGEYIPSLSASMEELAGIGRALTSAGTGVIEIAADLVGPDAGLENHMDLRRGFGFLRDLAQRTARPLSFLLTQDDRAPDAWREILLEVEDAVSKGVQIRAQVAPRAVGVMCGWELTNNPFGSKPSYREIADRPLSERLEELKQPARRDAILSEELGTHKFTRRLAESLDRMFALDSVKPDYEPAPHTSIAVEAARRSVTAEELAYDMMLEQGGRQLLYFPMQNYSQGNLDAVKEMLCHPLTVPGLSDGGAHAATLCDVGFPTFLIYHWARDRDRGDRLSLEEVVRMHTQDAAEMVGLRDRGILKPGYRADLNVIDFDSLGVPAPELIHDLPGGGRRLVQTSEGYCHTFCAGVETVAQGKPTGAMPGRLVRGPKGGIEGL